MASYQHLVQHSNLRGESPAKVFARLKSKVQREGVCGKDGTRTRNDPLCYVKRNQGAEVRSPWKTTESARMEDDLQENPIFGSGDEAKALTISPISSPRKNFGCWNSHDTLVDNEHLVSGRGHGCTPKKGVFLESTAVPQPQFSANRKQNHVESARFRDLDVFNAGNKTSMKSVSDTSVFSPMRNRLRKRKCGPWDCRDISSSTKIHDDTGGHCPESNTYVIMEDLVQRPRFSAVTHFPQEPIMPPPRSMAKKSKICLFSAETYIFSSSEGSKLNGAVSFWPDFVVLLEKCPPLSPAKMFEFMKKRESQAGHRDVHRVFNSRRNIFDRSECVWSLLVWVLLPPSRSLTPFAQVRSIRPVIHLHLHLRTTPWTLRQPVMKTWLSASHLRILLKTSLLRRHNPFCSKTRSYSIHRGSLFQRGRRPR